MVVYHSEANGRLALQVEMRNRVNKKAIELHSQLADVLTGWIGKKIIRVTPYKSWTSILKRQIDAVEAEFLGAQDCKYRLTFEFGLYYVWANLEIIFDDNLNTCYRKAAFNLCSIEQPGHLLEIASAPELKTDYEFRNVSLQIRELSDLQDRARNLESELRYFAIH